MWYDSSTSLPAKRMKKRYLLYGVLILIFGIFTSSMISPYTSCSYYNIFCERRLKNASELLGEYVFPVFLIILGTLIIIGWLLSQSPAVQDYVRDWIQQQRRPQE